jgi:4-hydroxy-2-oxoheptanedioate aldolase
MVMSPEEARVAVAACKYPPLGNRSLGGALHALNYGTRAEGYYAGADEEILVVIQTEHIDAVEKADEIYSVPGIDAIFVGPNDLAASLREARGVQPTPQRVEEVLLRIREAAARHNVPCGIHVKNPDDAQRRIDEGWRFIAVGSELAMMLQYATALSSRFNQDGASAGLANY